MFYWVENSVQWGVDENTANLKKVSKIGCKIEIKGNEDWSDCFGG